MKQKKLDELNELSSLKYGMKWYGWGSPIGLGIFFLRITLVAAIIKTVFFE